MSNRLFIDDRDRLTAAAELTNALIWGLFDDDPANQTLQFNAVVRITSLTASRLVATDADKDLTSVANLATWISGTANEIDITDDGDGTITIGIVDPLIVGKGGTGAATLTDGGILLGSGTGAITALGVATNGQIPIGDGATDPVLATITGTANQVTVTNGAGTITLSLPQNIHTAATPQFAGGTYTGVVTGVTPTAGTHLATKEYIDLALGARKDFFLSDTASGIGALNYVYPHETGGASSTIITAGLGLGDAQLVKGFITEAGQPATTTIHEGVISFHLHAKKGAANQRTTTLYAIISRVDADGTSNKTTVATSETTEALDDTEVVYDLHAAVADDIEIASTARLILDVYANVGAGALDAVITLYMEGADDSYFSTKVDSGIWQNHGDVLDDLNTVGEVTGDSYFLVGAATGVFAWETGATVRTSLGLGTGDSPQFAQVKIDDVSTYIDKDGSNNMTFTDAVTGTRTLKNIGCPVYHYIKATGQAEGDLHLSDGTNWAVSKAIIQYIRVITSSTNWDMYILQNDNGYAADDAVIPKMKIADGIIGNANLWLDLPYQDEDASGEVHLYYLDNSGANTATIIIKGTELI